MFVGKKKQAQEAIKSEAERSGMFYMNQRWLGGTLTNFQTIRTRIDKLNKLNQMEAIGEFELLPKKEVIKLKAERDTVVDLRIEHIAVKEAKALGIPIVGLVDTNCDPDLVDYVIPGNDDAIRAVKLIASIIADAVVAAKEGVEYLPSAEQEEETVQEVKAEEIFTDSEAEAPATEE